MADSSESSGLTKPLPGHESEPPKEPKKTRKRSKKLSRAKFSEESPETRSQQSLTTSMDEDRQNVKEIEEKSEENFVESEETVTKTGESFAAIGEEASAQAETEGAKQEQKNNEELEGKGGPQGSNATEESSDKKQDENADAATEQDDAESSKKSKRTSLKFLRSRKNSKSKLSSGEVKRVEHMADKSENNDVDAKQSVKEDDSNEQQKEIKDEAKIEQYATCEDAESKDTDISLGGTQEKSLGKGNKEKKLKKLASFGRNKKKPDTAVKQKDSERAEKETGELEKEDSSDARSGRKKSQNNENELNEMNASLDKSGSMTESFDKEKEDDEEKQAGHVKRKASFLGFKRTKQQSKKQKSLKNGEQLTTETDQGEEIAGSKSGDIGDIEGGQLKGATDGFDEEVSERKEDSEKVEEKGDLQADEGSLVAETMEESNKEEISGSDEKAKQEATTAEEMSQTSTKKNRKSSILRSFRKLRSPKKKIQENEKSASTNEDDAKKTEQADNDETSEMMQSTEKKSASETDEECSPKAVKRKTSDLKNIGLSQPLKRKKEDGHFKGDDADDEDEVGNEEVAKEKDKIIDDSSKALSKQKNNIENQLEDKEGEVMGEVSREPTARNEPQGEEQTSKETRETMETFITELVEFMEKKEEQIAKEKHVEADDNYEQEETEDESYDSDLTIVSEITVVSSAYDLAAERKTLLKTGDKEFRGIYVRESSDTNRLRLIEARSENLTEPKTGDEEKPKDSEDGKESSENETGEVKPQVQADKTESATENEREYSKELEETITPVYEDAAVFSARDALQGIEPPAESVTQPNTEDSTDAKESAEFDALRALQSIVDGEAEPTVDGEADNDEPKVDRCLQGQLEEVPLTQPERNDDISGGKNKTNKQDKKKSKANKDGSDPFANSPSAWIMVQHLEVNEEISRQLGNMLPLNAFKRTTACCTIL